MSQDTACFEKLIRPPLPPAAPRTNPGVCLLGATFETANMGVNALTVGAIKVVRQRWNDAAIFLLDYAKTPTAYVVEIEGAQVNVPLVNMRFSKRLYLPNHILTLIALALVLRVLPGAAARKWISRRNPCLARVMEADFVASVAGGDSFSDIYGIVNFFYIALPQLLCLILRKRLLLFPQTFGPYKSRVARVVARYIVARAERVYSRDYKGLSDMRALVGPNAAPNMRFCHDVGILLDPHPSSEPLFADGASARDRSRRLVGLNVSGLLSSDGAQFARRARFAADYDALVRSLIESLIRSEGASVLLVPHVFGQGSESDSTVCGKLYSELLPKYPDSLYLAGGAYDQHQVKHVIGSCDFFIGSRMHACIAAASQGVPAACLAYSDKFIGVMETLGLAPLVVDLRTAREPEALAAVRAGLGQMSRYRAALREQMPKWRQSVLDLLADVTL